MSQYVNSTSSSSMDLKLNWFVVFTAIALLGWIIYIMSEQIRLALVVTLANAAMFLMINRFEMALQQTRSRLAETQDQLRESEYRFGSVFENSHVGIYFLTLQGNILMCNQYGAELIGYSMKELLAMHPHDITHPDDQVVSNQRFLELRAGKRNSYQLEKRYIHKNGHVVWVDLRVSLVCDDAGEPSHCVASAVDITQHKQAADAANRARSRYIANTSHEIRNPINAVAGMVDLLLLTNLDSDQKEYLRCIRNSADLLGAISNDILDHAKMESGKLKVIVDPFVLSTCIQESVSIFVAMAAAKNLRLSFTINPDVPPIVASDSIRLRQILGNLVSNAIKFTETGEVNISVASEWQEDVHFLHFTVQDTGIGIPEEATDRLFEAFEQMDSSTSRVYGGTGLGLSISKQLVELLGGNIWVESHPGEGCTFHFTIKAEPISEMIVAPTPELASTLFSVDGNIPSPLRVLLAEDNLANQKVTLYMLHRLGYQADLAVTGKEVLDALAQNRYDLILMDIEMPELDGVETTHAIRTQFSLEWQPYIIALTGHVSDGSRDYFLEVGIDDYISKPVRMKDLAAALQSVQLPVYTIPRDNGRNGKHHDLFNYDLRTEVSG
jgi:PAS domain S-box-containing protein